MKATGPELLSAWRAVRARTDRTTGVIYAHCLRIGRVPTADRISVDCRIPRPRVEKALTALRAADLIPAA